MDSHSGDAPLTEDHHGRTRFVTLCQQLLVLAVVATVLTPAARTISLDVRPSGPDSAATADAGLQQTGGTSEVPAGEVESTVEEVPLTAPAGVRGRTALRADVSRVKGVQRVESKPMSATGYATIGVTWDGKADLHEEDASFQVRSRVDGEWSAWSEVPFHDEHGPDPDSAEGAGTRPGTEPVVVGDVDDVQVRVDAKGSAPEDLKVAVIDPGTEKKTVDQAPSIDTARTAATTDDSQGEGDAGEEGDTDTDAVELAAATTAKPKIFSRRQWGANEELRDRGSLSYYEVHGGFVHHTVNSNNYKANQVDDIIRSIYAYHTRSRGWSDIGYNFLVDKFGRIWEGRAGGVDRPVVGAHTLGYNSHSFAGSAIGNFESGRPSGKMIDAFARLFAWKLSLHGVNAKTNKVWIAGDRFQAISGHRDAGSTACPGRYLYAQLDQIRNKARSYQSGWGGRNLDSDLAGGGAPDLVMMRKSDGQGMVLPLHRTKTRYYAGSPINTGVSFSNARDVLKVGDWDGDGHGDLIIRRKSDDKLYLHRGNGKGKFSGATVIAGGFQRIGKLAAVGDFDGDGRPDLIGKPWGAGKVNLYRGNGMNGVHSGYRIYRAVSGSPVPIGRWNRGGAPDVLLRNGSSLTAYLGNGPGGYVARRNVNFDPSRYNAFVGVHNFGKGPHSDVIAREKGTHELYFIPASYSGSFKSRIQLGKKLADYRKIS
ncbi:N-acetylmuramoyl-L-alanine amidase [Nocardioides panacisoli]|uniref:N-acetylmuramoyl-L-alanine amidase n=1 Tax=Nocardioides panacisoli TaxID=627624 RepID=UPI001C633AB5|nr:N-acetylmuramoyl-L-alanine amidase [Nocardioides panacisoli]QYJ04398.1 N-acetylmuramoyl-L-alanine amidase [Nocardioides panacisoli]